MFARLDFPRFLVCYLGHLSGNKSEEKASVAICGGLSQDLAYIDWPNSRVASKISYIVHTHKCRDTSLRHFEVRHDTASASVVYSDVTPAKWLPWIWLHPRPSTGQTAAILNYPQDTSYQRHDDITIWHVKKSCQTPTWGATRVSVLESRPSLWWITTKLYYCTIVTTMERF